MMKATDELLEFIKDLKKDKSLNSFDEAATKQIIILKVLNLLGWNVYDREEVYPEYSVKGKKVDYSLRLNFENKVFIEVKKVSQKLYKHQSKLLDYLDLKKVDSAVLTNGLKWWFYAPLKDGKIEYRKFYSIDITEQNAGEVSERLYDFLYKSKVISGDNILVATKIFSYNRKKKIIERTLPRAVAAIFEEADKIFVDLIKDHTENKCGYRPSDELVKEFLYKNFSKKKLKSISPVKAKGVKKSLQSEICKDMADKIQTALSI